MLVVLLVWLTLGVTCTMVLALAESDFGVPKGSSVLLRGKEASLTGEFLDCLRGTCSSGGILCCSLRQIMHSLKSLLNLRHRRIPTTFDTDQILAQAGQFYVSKKTA